MNTTSTISVPLVAGEPAADFTLRATNGMTYSSAEVRKNSLVLVVLFHTGCGTCKYTFPYIQRFETQYAQPSGGRFQVWGVSQDDAEETVAFAARYGGATFPLLPDTEGQVAEQYGITNVPNLYLLGQDENILFSVVGHFSRDKFNALAKYLADALTIPYTPVVRDEDDAPALKPG